MQPARKHAFARAGFSLDQDRAVALGDLGRRLRKPLDCGALAQKTG